MAKTQAATAKPAASAETVNDAFAASVAASVAASAMLESPDYSAIADYNAAPAASADPANPLAAILANPDMLVALKAMLAPAASVAAPAASAKVSYNGAPIAPANPHAYKGGNLPLSLTVVAVAANTKRGASANRFARYVVGATLADHLKDTSGPTKADFLWDIRHGLIIVE